MLCRDVDVARPCFHGIKIIAERMPVPLQAFVHYRAGDVFDAFHQFDEPLAVALAHRRETHAAIAHDCGGDAMPTRRRKTLVPRRLTVVMRVDIDEAWRDELALRVDLFPAF